MTMSKEGGASAPPNEEVVTIRSEGASRMAKKAKSGQSSETPHAKFQRLAPPRVEAALKKISLIGNLAGSGYAYEPAEAKQISDALMEAVEDVVSKFSRSKSGRKGFAFKQKG
jgi:hypothetical protein